jgi:hypothetical protein
MKPSGSIHRHTHKETGMNHDNRKLDANRDPLTGAPGESLSGRDYVEQGSSFEDYGPVYGFSVNSRSRYPGRDFDSVESEMPNDWAVNRGKSSLSWERAKHAAGDAWNRISPTN